MCQLSGHSGISGEVATDNPQVHAAFTQARVFWRNPEKLSNLSPQNGCVRNANGRRISRKIQRNEERPRTLQNERKAAFNQALWSARCTPLLIQEQAQC